MMQLFKFDTLVTPSIIKFMFYFGVVCSALGALATIGSGLELMKYQPMLGFAYIIGGLMIVLAGVVMSRVVTEFTLVIFMIRDELAWQRQQATGRSADVPSE
jgi:hypothetical protein